MYSMFYIIEGTNGLFVCFFKKMMIDKKGRFLKIMSRFKFMSFPASHTNCHKDESAVERKKRQNICPGKPHSSVISVFNPCNIL